MIGDLTLKGQIWKGRYEGYCRWGWLVIYLSIVAAVLVMAFSIYAIVFIFSNKLTSLTLTERFVVRKQTIQMVIVCMGLVLFLDYAFLKNENPFEKIKMFEQECEEIQMGNYKMAEVYLHPENYESDNLWGSSEESNCRFTSYHAIGDDFLWDKIYVPDYIEFELDADNPYNEWKDVEWNEENAARYKITYTPNFRIIIDIETLPPNGPIERIYEFSDEIDASGYTKKITDENDKKWRHNVSHIELESGGVMDFYWEGPDMLGYLYGSSDKLFMYKDSESTWSYQLLAWPSDYYDGIINDAISMTKEEWLTNCVLTYADGPFETEGDDETFEVVFAGENQEAKGYCYYLIDAKHEIFYQFAYVENVYDEKRAKRVINSIKYAE